MRLTMSVQNPEDCQWSPSTIYGNWRRDTGILNIAPYVGKTAWNRQHFVKTSGRETASSAKPQKDVGHTVSAGLADHQ